jgi:hypothetical protein
MQLKEIKMHLKKNQHLKHVWYDYMCLPQGLDRTPLQKAEFALQLSNVNVLYMGASVLLLVDWSSMSRFWTAFETWLSFQKGSETGLVSVGDDKEFRGTIVCVNGASSDSLPRAIKEEWMGCSVEDSMKKLGNRSVMSVTNGGDIDIQLEKVAGLSELTRSVFKSLDEHQTMEDFSILAQPGRPAIAGPPALALRSPKAAASSNVLDSNDELAGLGEWLAGLSLQKYRPQAAQWCIEMGAVSMDEVEEHWEAFADAMNLKPFERTRLAKKVAS